MRRWDLSVPAGQLAPEGWEGAAVGLDRFRTSRLAANQLWGEEVLQ